MNLHEVTIRYLGGLIATYDLSQDLRLRDKADELGQLLLTAFRAENGMPCSLCALVTDPLVSFSTLNRVAMAAVGALSVDCTRLAKIIGN